MNDQHETPRTVPANVAAAIVAVMMDVPTLKKDDTNKHGGYQFTSVDGFLTAIRPICAKHGLAVLTDELETEVTGGNLSVRFGFTLVHASGDCFGPIARTVQVNAKMGAQAYGAAQSYALKQFLRATFQVATGDGEDADRQPHHDLTETRRPAPRKQAATPDHTAILELRKACMDAAAEAAGSDERDDVLDVLKAAKDACNLKPLFNELDAEQLAVLLEAIHERAEVAA